MITWICTIPVIAGLFGACAGPDALAVGYVEGEYVLLAPIETARVETIAVERGDRFEKGQLLVTLETRDAENAVAEALAAKDGRRRSPPSGQARASRRLPRAPQRGLAPWQDRRPSGTGA